MVEYVQQDHVTVCLAAYPPSHSKDNPMERCWGIVEKPGNGALLASIDAGRPCAAPMTWKGIPPVVSLVTTASPPGITLTKEAMEAVEASIKRFPRLGKWFMAIVPLPPLLWVP
jgi:hypothetical protein